MSFLKKNIYINPIYLLCIFNLIIIGGIVFGLLPREVILGSAFLIFLYLFLMKLEDGVLFFVLNIPLFVAIPISRGFDSLNIWRIAILILTVKLLLTYFPVRKLFASETWNTLLRRTWAHLVNNKVEFWTILYFIIATLSVLVAADKGAAIKRIFYVGQMILVYPLVLHVLHKKNLIDKLIKYLFASSIFVFLVGILQLFFSYFTSLSHFWSWWTWKVSQTFYGTDLANIVSGANTWFSYSPDRSPRLRLFSTMTDSHSFALYLVLATPILLWFIVSRYLKNKKISAILILQCTILCLMQFFIALSGTRGVWLSVAAPIAIAIYFLIKKESKQISKIILIALSTFVIMLLASSLFLSISQFNVKDKTDNTLTLKRLKSISDIEETSNKGRLFIWAKSVESIIKRPILGVGMGNFPVILEQDIVLQKAGSTAHNVYLNSGAEMGIFGLILNILIFYEILRRCYLHFKEKEKNNYNLLVIFLGFYFLWIFAYSFFDVAIFDARVMMFFAAEVAIVFSLPLLNKKNERISA
jgi:O-antigen ligase